MQLFIGPGKYLVIPMHPLRITNPKCEHQERLFGTDKYKPIKNNPPCICITNHFIIPWGYWYKTEDHPEIIRPATRSEILETN